MDFQNKYIAIHNSHEHKSAELSLWLDTIGGQYIIRDFPFRFPVGRDTVSTYINLLLDTGSPESICYLYDAPDSILQQIMSSPLCRKYECPIISETKSTMFLLHEVNFYNDEIWIECRERLRPWRITGEFETVVAGLNFLKAFHIFLIPNDRRIDFIKTPYITIEEELFLQDSHIGSEMRAFKNVNGDAVIDYLRNGSFYWNTGLRIGDILTSVNSTKLFDLPRGYFRKMATGTDVSFCLIRGVDTLHLKGNYTTH